jgi:hypothetical protein
MAYQTTEVGTLARLRDVKSTGSDGAAVVVAADVTARTDSDSEKHDIETTEDGRFHQYIERDGQQVLVSWTKAEEARVVRKADFFLLPLFTVCVI